jgi:hypothetical protein
MLIPGLTTVCTGFNDVVWKYGATNGCPNTGGACNGCVCKIRPCPACDADKSKEGRWSANDNTCVQCSGNLKTAYYTGSPGGFLCGDCNSVVNSIPTKCESACGAPAVCDEKPPVPYLPATQFVILIAEL